MGTKKILSLLLMESMAAPRSIKTKLISLAAGLFISAQAVFASVQTVAVLPSEGVLDANELEFLTNKAQEIAVRMLPRNTFEVFPRDVIIRRLGGVENYFKECREASCIVDLGKKAQVDYVSQCSFGKLSSNLTVAFELYKVSTSGLVDKFTERAKDIDGLLAVMERRIPEGFLKIPGASPKAKAPPPSEPPPPPPQNLQELHRIEWRKFRGDFHDLEDFYYSAEIGFSKYFKRYSPQIVSKSEKALIMEAKYGKYDIICTFYRNETSQYIVSIDTKSNRDRVKWIENVVKQVEKQRK